MKRCTHDAHDVQDFNREHDGRVFTCAFCAFKVCVDCDSPEHEGETCSDYRSRMADIHGAAEAKSMAAKKDFCPGCDAPISKPGGCSYSQCGRCFYRFCSGCMIPWVGVGSSYLGGRWAHSPGCVYHLRDYPSAHSMKHRYLEEEEGWARECARRLANRIEKQAKKRAMAELSEEPQPKKKRGGHKTGKESQTKQKEKKRGGDNTERKDLKIPKGPRKLKTESTEAEPELKGKTKQEFGVEQVEVKPEIKNEM